MPNTNIIDILLKIFPTEQACIDYFEEHRWNGKTNLSLRLHFHSL